MDDRGFAFEERKQQNNRYNNKNDMEYSKGGGGDGPKSFYSVKTNIYSRECYNDPNNPGKMICKETNNTSGYDPFNKQSNFNKSKENIYTKEYRNQNNFQNTNEESMFDTISGKIKGLFSPNYDENAKNKALNDQNDYNFIQENNTYAPHQYNQEGFRKNLNSFNRNEIDPEFDSRDPFIDEFERLLSNIQSAFQIGSYFEDELSKHFTGGQFGNGFHFGNSHDDKDNQDHFFHHSNYQFNPSENYNYPDTSPDHCENQKDFRNLNNFGQGNQFINQKKLPDDTKEIKFSDSKIYDV